MVKDGGDEQWSTLITHDHSNDAMVTRSGGEEEKIFGHSTPPKTLKGFLDTRISLSG